MLVTVKYDNTEGSDVLRAKAHVMLRCPFVPKFSTRNYPDRRTDKERSEDYGKCILWLDKQGYVCKAAEVRYNV